VWLDEWLEGLGLTQYKANFVDKGYDVKAAASKLNLEKLIGLGVTKEGHQGALLDAVAALNGLFIVDLFVVCHKP